MRTYVTGQRERLDQICQSEYGSIHPRVVEQVLEANKSTALTPILAEGTTILLPSGLGGELAAIRETVKLWGRS